MIAEKQDASYNETLNWIRCSIRFKLLRSSIQSLRGSQSFHDRPVPHPVELIMLEARASLKYG